VACTVSRFLNRASSFLSVSRAHLCHECSATLLVVTDNAIAHTSKVLGARPGIDRAVRGEV
jgi:hypothetical protein